ncbi:hypothetical protein HY643_02810 [Candidatus Woesearchaeota archaeon]|nr:hypothetical protein [Candidatus Woesearchaeota archaeon]
MSYTERSIRAYNDLKNNWILFIPNIIKFFSVLILTLFLYKLGGFNVLAKQLTSPQLYTTFDFQLEIFKDFFKTNWIRIAISAALFLLTNFFIGVGADTIKYGMIANLTTNKKTELKKVWENKKKYFWKLVSLKLAIYILSIALVGLVTFISAILIYQIKSLSTILSFSLVAFAAFLAIVVLKLFLFFVYPALFIGGRNNFLGVIKHSASTFTSKPKIVLIIWAITLALGVGVGLFDLFFGWIINVINDALSNMTLIFFLSNVGTFIVFLIKTGYTLWSELFVFNNYKELKL